MQRHSENYAPIIKGVSTTRLTRLPQNDFSFSLLFLTFSPSSPKLVTWLPSSSETETQPSFTFSALPMGSGGEDFTSPTQHKRVRTDDFPQDKLQASLMTDTERISPKPLGAPNNQTSYASMVLNPLNHYSGPAIEEIEFADEDCVYSKGKLGTNVCFSERVYNKLDLGWRCAVIIKLMGKPNSNNAIKFMADSLRRKWNLQGPWQIIDLPNDYFVVKFHLHEDLNIALCGGPWIIAGQTLVVQQWKSDFNPSLDEITTMAVWVRIVGLPPRYYNEFTMRKIGHTLGSVVKVDTLTLAQARGQFGRLCVEINLKKPLAPYVEVEGIAYGVVYEGISMICFNCGCYGHVKASCPYQKSEQPDTVPPEVNPSTLETNVDSGVESNSPNAVDSEGTSPILKNDVSPTGAHGPWMLMSYKSKKKESSSGVGTSKLQSKSGSRFSILVNEDEDVMPNTNDKVNISVQPRPPVTKPSVAKDNEPKIVTIWKQVQKKIRTKSTAKANLQTPRKTTMSLPSSSSKTTNGQPQPLLDITNGKCDMDLGNPKSFPSKPKEAETSGNAPRPPVVPNMKLTFPHSELNPLNGNPSNLPSNFSASFGHCPPENDSFMYLDCEDSGVTNISTSNVQTYSDLASNSSEQADISTDMIEDLNDAEETLAVDTPSSKEEAMVVS